VLAWSHHGRLASEAAFARLAGVAPIPASSGQTIRYRLDRSGDRKLNRTLHQIILTRRRTHPPTIAYIDRRERNRPSLAERPSEEKELDPCLELFATSSLRQVQCGAS
jgi:transposase